MKGVIRGHGEGRRYFLEGREVTGEEFFAAFPEPARGPGEGLCGWKPLASDALAVHPSQVQEAAADARAKGVAVDFLPDGRPVFTSRGQRRAYLRAYGFHDRRGGYGDG